MTPVVTTAFSREPPSNRGMHEVAHPRASDSETGMRLLLIGAVLFSASRGANAACVISGVRPTVALPTLAAGQEFLFTATADCETVRFRVPGTRFARIPRAGPDTGSKDRTSLVALSLGRNDGGYGSDCPGLLNTYVGRIRVVIDHLTPAMQSIERCPA
jgi:hypothetical protein